MATATQQALVQKPKIHEYCTIKCNTRVVPNDPDKIEVDGVRYHRGCFNKLNQEKEKLTPKIKK